MTDYIEIRNWDRFQHADTTKRGRAPIWIKLYTGLLSDEDFLTLTEHRRLVLVCLWMEYARSRARLPLDTRSLTRRLQVRVTKADLEAIKNHGFIEFRQDNDVTLSGRDKRREEKTTTQALEPTSTEDVGGEHATHQSFEHGDDSGMDGGRVDDLEVLDRRPRLVSERLGDPVAEAKGGAAAGDEGAEGDGSADVDVANVVAGPWPRVDGWSSGDDLVGGFLDHLAGGGAAG